jgi:hypothetical protein
MNFVLKNFKQGKPVFRVYIPLEYRFSDLFEIIKIYTGYYSDNYDFLYYENSNGWEKNIKKLASLKTYFSNRSYDEIRLSEYFESKGATEYFNGSIRIFIYSRNIRNQTKVYPEVYNANGIFPTEEEFKKGRTNKDMDKLTEKDELKGFDEKMKEYFKKKYKISDELSEFYTWSNACKLEQI